MSKKNKLKNFDDKKKDDLPKQKLKSKNPIDELIKNPSMELAIMLLSYMMIVLVLYSILQILNINKVFSIIQIISIVMPIIIYLMKSTTKNKTKTIIITIYLMSLLITPYIFSKTYDLTMDGNSYHKSAIAFLKNGWNPLYETSKEFQKNNKEVIPIADDVKIDLWIEHYPKATWILAANIYNMTGNIESGKCITLILTIVLMIISYNCLKIILSRNWALLISILIAINPITLSQIFTYYLDSIMGICFALELILLLIIKPMEKQKYWIWIMIASVCTIFVNLKFTGLLYSGLIAAIFYFYWLFKYKKETNFWERFKTITINFTIVYIIAIFLVGANSYIKNTIDHKMPLYPLFGKDKVDIITEMQPQIFNKTSAPKKFFWSLFSKTSNVTYQSGKKPQLKLPFKIYKSEKKELMLPDVRIGGFGPFFAFTIILSLIFFIIAYIKLYKNEKRNIVYVNLILISIILSIIMVGEGWWARYIPQLYLFPILTIGLLIYTSKYFKNNIVSYIEISAIILAILINARLFINVNYDNIKTFVQIDKDISYLKKRQKPKITLPAKDLYGYLYTLNDNNVEYELVDKIDKNNKLYIYCWRLEIEKNENS